MRTSHKCWCATQFHWSGGKPCVSEKVPFTLPDKHENVAVDYHVDRRMYCKILTFSIFHTFFVGIIIDFCSRERDDVVNDLDTKREYMQPLLGALGNNNKGTQWTEQRQQLGRRRKKVDCRVEFDVEKVARTESSKVFCLKCGWPIRLWSSSLIPFCEVDVTDVCVRGVTRLRGRDPRDYIDLEVCFWHKKVGKVTGAHDSQWRGSGLNPV